jgi:hypothetical protein
MTRSGRLGDVVLFSVWPKIGTRFELPGWHLIGG